MAFIEPHIQLPRGSHTHTAILLHGLGSNGPEFAEDLFSSASSKKQNLAACLPGWRWVVPSSKTRWSSTFQEEQTSWFDIVSLTNTHMRKDLQVQGLRESVSFVLDVLDREIIALDNQTSRVFLGGISQGMATSLWTIFCATRRLHGPLGGFVGFCGWMPLATHIEEMSEEGNPGLRQARRHDVLNYVHATIAGRHEHPEEEGRNDTSVLSTPTFLCHGTDDPFVSVELGRQACAVMHKMMDHVEWKEFTGADNDGHWIKEPEGMDCLLDFFVRCIQKDV